MLVGQLADSPFKGKGAELIAAVRDTYLTFLSSAGSLNASDEPTHRNVVVLTSARPERINSFLAPTPRIRAIADALGSTDSCTRDRLRISMRSPHGQPAALVTALGGRMLGGGVQPRVAVALHVPGPRAASGLYMVDVCDAAEPLAGGLGGMSATDLSRHLLMLLLFCPNEGKPTHHTPNAPSVLYTDTREIKFVSLKARFICVVLMW